MDHSTSLFKNTWRRIGTRLFVAFGIVAIATVVSALVAGLAVERLSTDLSNLTHKQLPAASVAARIAEVGGNIRAEMPKLLTANSEKDRLKTRQDIEVQTNRLRELLQENTHLIDTPNRHSMLALLSEITLNLKHVDNNVSQRFRLKNKNTRLIERLRWAHADFLDEIDPIVEDASFNMNSALNRLVAPSVSKDLNEERRAIQEMTQMREAVMRVNAASNLTVGLIMRGAVQNSAQEIEGTRQFLSEVSDSLEKSISLIIGDPSNVSLRQAVDQILSFSRNENDVLGLRKKELLFEEKGQELLSQNNDLFLRLEQTVSSQIATAEVHAQQSIEKAERRIAQERFILILAALLSIAIFLFVGWGYVAKRIVSRLNNIRHSMSAIAAGNLETDVTVSGQDEITEMAKTLLVFRDTAREKNEAHEELIQATKLAVLGQMSAGIAHETNQTLSAITYNAHNANVLLKRNRIEEAASFIEKIGRIAEQMGKTVNHLKVFARRPSQKIEPVSASQITRYALSLFDERISKENIHIKTDRLDADLKVLGEAVRLEQIIVNLIANALDAMMEQAERKLTLSCFTQNNKGIIEVSDNGCGLSDEIRDKIFDPFFTTKEVGEGLGLGLSITQKIITDLDGLLEIDSQMGRGSTFRIILELEEQK